MSISFEKTGQDLLGLLLYTTSEILEAVLGPPPAEKYIIRLHYIAPIKEIPAEGVYLWLYSQNDKPAKQCIVHGAKNLVVINSPVKMTLNRFLMDRSTLSPIIKILSQNPRVPFLIKNDRYLLWVCVYNSDTPGKEESVYIAPKSGRRVEAQFLASGKWFKTPHKTGEDPKYPYTLFQCTLPKPKGISYSDSKQWNVTITLVRKRQTVIDGRATYHNVEYLPVVLKKNGKIRDFTIRGTVAWKWDCAPEKPRSHKNGTGEKEKLL